MIEWLGPILWEAYAATEGGGTLVGSSDWLKFPGTVGKAIPGTRIRILNDRGETLPAGGIGTIYMTRYLGDRFEYLGDPERTRACHDGEFFTVGDIGYLNEEGFLFICDRKVDMINLSGMKVYSAEVENALALHPQVADSAVFGVPDEFTGEAVVAYVQPVRNVDSHTGLKTDLRRFLGEHLSMVKIPRDIELVPALARDPAGKPQKKRMREQHLARIDDRLGQRQGQS
jgi:long-chain acyl-CoA synthetase